MESNVRTVLLATGSRASRPATQGEGQDSVPWGPSEQSTLLPTQDSWHICRLDPAQRDQKRSSTSEATVGLLSGWPALPTEPHSLNGNV